MSRIFLTLIVATGMLACPSSLRAQTFPDVPSGTVAWVACDPTDLPEAEDSESRRSLVEAVVRTTLENVLFQDDVASNAVAPILAAAFHGQTPFRVSLLSYACESVRQGRDNGIRITACRLVVEVHATSEPMRDALARSTDDGTWPDWLAIESRDADGLLTIGIGDDALRAWDNVQGNATGHWQTHQLAVQQTRPNASPFFQCFVDLNKMRRIAPEPFVAGRADRVLRTLGLLNTRSLMIHGLRTPTDRVRVQGTQSTYEGPPLLSVMTTYSARSREFSRIGAQLFGSGVVGGIESEIGTPDGGWQLIGALDVDQVIALGVGLYRGSIPDWEAKAFSARQRRWIRVHERRLAQVRRALMPIVILTSDGTEEAPIRLGAVLATNPGINAAAVSDAIAALVESLGATVAVDQDARLHTLMVGETPVLSFGPAKGTKTECIAIGFSPEAVTGIRGWLED